MARLPTRGQALQVKPGALLARSRRRLDQARRLIEQVSYDWCEIAGAVGFDCDEAAKAIDVVTGTVTNAASWLRGPDDGESFDG